MYGKFSLRAKLPVFEQKTGDDIIPYEGGLTGGSSVLRARKTLQLKEEKKATRETANAKTDEEELRLDEKVKILAAGANKVIAAKWDTLLFGFTPSQPGVEKSPADSFAS
jgi:hypothetical protein